MQAQVQIMTWQVQIIKYNVKKKTVLNLKSMLIVGFEQTFTKFTEIFVP